MEKEHTHQIELIGIAKLRAHDKNSNKHPEAQLKQLAKSIREFGFTKPILINADNVILAGHGAWMAAKRCKLMEVPCVRVTHLTEQQQRAYVIADNRLPKDAEWDFDLLATEIDWLNEQGFDVSTLGFTDAEFAELIGTPNAPPEQGDDEVENKGCGTTICPKCGHEFTL